MGAAGLWYPYVLSLKNGHRSKQTQSGMALNLPWIVVYTRTIHQGDQEGND